jgi:hypothetical protein
VGAALGLPSKIIQGIYSEPVKEGPIHKRAAEIALEVAARSRASLEGPAGRLREADALVQKGVALSRRSSIPRCPYAAGQDGARHFERKSGVGPFGGVNSFAFDVVTPEPATLLLWGAGATGLGLARWRRRLAR